MHSITRRNSRWPFLASLVILGAALGSTLPGVRTAQAVGRADKKASRTADVREEIKTAKGFSAAFESVAKSLRPSIVSVHTLKRFEPTTGDRRSPRARTPEGLREFFGGDDLFSQFFGQSAPGKGFAQSGLGSGVIVNADGTILTNNHVVAGADELTVTLADGSEHQAKVLGTDDRTDLSVVKIEAKNLEPAELGDSDALQVGDWVLAMGSPFGLTETVTAGIVSAKGRANVGIADYEDFIQTDASIYPGNSGGPLVDLDGRVVGINTAILSPSMGPSGIGFAIPSRMAKSVMESIVRSGKVERGWLGVSIQNLTDDLSRSFGFEGKGGVLVGDVTAGGPAEKAGLRSGDIIVKLDGEEMADVNHLRNAVAAQPAGKKVTVDAVRDGKPISFDVEVAELKSNGRESAPDSPDQPEGLGLTVENLSSQAASRLGIKGPEGVLVTDVEDGSLAERAGVRENDVILVVGGKPVSNVGEFRSALKEKDLSQGVVLQLLTGGTHRYVVLKRIS